MSSIIQLGAALKFNGGGHLNHSIFWNVLTPNGTSEPTGELKKLLFLKIHYSKRNFINKGPLAEAIKRDFGSQQNLVQLLINACVSELFL